MLEDKAISAERRFLRQRERHGCTQEAKYVVVPCSADSQGPDRCGVDCPFKWRREEKKFGDTQRKVVGFNTQSSSRKESRSGGY